MEEMKKSMRKRIAMYEKLYENAADLSDVFRELERNRISVALTSFLQGVLLAVLYGSGVDAYREMKDFIDDLDCEIINQQTITGIPIA